MDENNRNFILAIVLSMVVLFGWQYFFVPKPPSSRRRDAAAGTTTAADQAAAAAAGARPPAPGAPRQAAPNAPHASTREEALAASPRVAIDTPALKGSINAQGRADRRSDAEELSRDGRAGQPERRAAVAGRRARIAYYTEHGWVAGAESKARRSRRRIRCGQRRRAARSRRNRRSPSPTTTARGLSSPAPSRSMTNTCSPSTTRSRTRAPSQSRSIPYGARLAPRAAAYRSFYILHEGLIGVVDDGLEQITYKKALDNPPQTFKSKSGWLGITDKYWAAVVMPEQGKPFEASSPARRPRPRALPGRLPHGRR